MVLSGIVVPFSWIVLNSSTTTTFPETGSESPSSLSISQCDSGVWPHAGSRMPAAARTVRLLEMQGWMRKIFSAPTDPHIVGKLSARRFDRCIVRLHRSSFRVFIARSLLSPVPVMGEHRTRCINKSIRTQQCSEHPPRPRICVTASIGARATCIKGICV